MIRHHVTFFIFPTNLQKPLKSRQNCCQCQPKSAVTRDRQIIRNCTVSILSTKYVFLMYPMELSCGHVSGRCDGTLEGIQNGRPKHVPGGGTRSSHWQHRQTFHKNGKKRKNPNEEEVHVRETQQQCICRDREISRRNKEMNCRKIPDPI